ncbi:MAG: ATP-grasp domain-containing protein [Myxococcales bacterium]|nr:ATP-grasp domain-containing protein [Myxococcales bacterium]
MKSEQSIRRVAIWNRGEAAVRCLRTLRTWRAARGLAVEAVAFYTEPDADALFVRLADDAEPLGPALRAGPDGRAVSAYCDLDHVLARLRETRCDAVWPGWGFVSEDAAFVERLEAAGIAFIGPRAETLRALGDKIAARERAEAAGVPLAPWATLPEDAPTARWIEAAARVGYPLMVKASAGGGGRGIRRVDAPDALPAALAAVRAEAARSFGGGGVLLEACIRGGRHVEVQLVGDGQGQAWALGVRDCSIQRRHQKIIEESPSPVLPADVAATIQSSAVRLAAAVAYRGAGTAEFLYAPADGLITFLEVNARLQVEHPLTELTAGLDLVEAQLDIAFGLPFEPPGAPRGHAIEARLNAEDPAHGFAPRPGRLRVFRPPTGPGIRVDTGVEEGQAIAPEFDSMIAKIIAFGATRAQARARLDAALAELDLVVEDGATNRAFLRAVLAHPAFIDGSADTAWLDRHAPALVQPTHGHEALAAAALLVARQGRDAAIHQYFREVQGGIPHRLPPPDGAMVELSVEGVHQRVRVLDRPGDAQVVAVDGRAHHARLVLDGPHAGALELDGRVHRVLFAEGATGLSVEVDGEAHHIERAAGGVIQAPMPAVVVAVAVEAGDAVAAGDVLCTVEAMKMETTICAPVAGVVRQVAVRVHQQVASGQALVLLDPAGSAAPAARAAAAAAEAVDPRGWSAEESPARVAALAEAVRALLLGFDLAPADRRATLEALEAAAAGPLAAPAAWQPLVALLGAYADTQALFDCHLQPAAGEAVAISAERAFHGWCRRLGQGEAEPDRHLAPTLDRALAWHGAPASLAAARAAAWRLAVARAHGAPRHRACTALLRLAAGLHGAGVPLQRAELRDVLDRVADLAAARHRPVEDHARHARFLLFEQPHFARQGALLEDVVGPALAQAEAGPPAMRAAALQALVRSPHSLSALLLRKALAHPAALPALLGRLYADRLGPVETRTEAGLTCAVARVLGDEDVQGLAAVLTPLDRLDAALAVATDLATPDRAVEVFVAGTSPIPAFDAALTAALPAAAGLTRAARVTVTAANGNATLRHRGFRLEAGALVADPVLRDIHPEAARRLELWRLSAFHLTRLDAPEPLHAFHAVAVEHAGDERVFVFADLREGPESTDRAGWTIERAFHEAVAVVRQAQASRDPRRRLHGNRICLDLRPVVDLSAERVAAIARRFEGSTRGLGLEKVVVRARLTSRPAGDPPAIFVIGRPGRHRLEVREEPPTDDAIRPRSPYRLRVAAARRLGAVYPYEVIRMLVGSGQGIRTPHPDLGVGSFQELDLDADGARLVPVDRPYGENTCGVVVGVIRNETPKHPEGLARVFIAGDPTHAMGALAEPECRRILAALDLAAERDLPVEWLPVSAGARIAFDSGTENLDWTAVVLRRLVELTEAGGEVNLIVHAVNVGAQAYWNAEATMLMHTRGLLIMTGDGSMVLTGKKALEYSGGVAAEDERGIGGYERVMGRNGQAQRYARDLGEAWFVLFEHYRHTARAPGERHARGFTSLDPVDRDVRLAPYTPVAGEPFSRLGDIFDPALNAERKKPFDIRQLMAAVADADAGTFERWPDWLDAATAVTMDAHLGGTPVCLIGIESRSLPRADAAPLDGPESWSGATLFPESARKVARALNAASGNRPAVILANLSGFDGSPESLRRLQLEYGAEIGRAVVRFRGPIVFLVVGRYHGGAYVVFSKALNPRLTALAVEGSFASVIGGAPAAAVVFTRDVRQRVQQDPRLAADKSARDALTLEHQGALAREFDAIHTVQRAVEVGSLDAVIPAARIRPALIEALRRGLRR